MFSHYVRSAKNILVPRSARLCNELWPAGTVLQKRNYLPATFQCENAWNQRLNEDLVKKIGKPGEFYLKMLQKMRTEFKIWPLDLDLYIHALESESSDWHPAEVLEIVNRYRRSGGVSLEVLESTQHAAIRLLLARGHTHELLTLISQPQQRGIFLDNFTAPLVMDYFLEKGDYASSSVVAVRLMLTEQFENPLTNYFALLSSLLYLKHCANTPNVDYTYSPAEPPERVLLRINYYNKSYDDDELRTSEHKRLVGKTLAWSTQKLLNDELRLNLSILGYAAAKHWQAFRWCLVRLPEAGGLVPFVREEVQQLLSEATDEELRGESKGELEASLESLTAQPELDVVGAVEEVLKHSINASKSLFVADLESLYKKWAAERQELFEAQCEAFERAQLMKSIKEKKKTLKEKEELLYFFDREVEKDVLKATRVTKHPFLRERPRQFRHKEKRKATFDKYIPPSMVGGRIIKLPTD